MPVLLLGSSGQESGCSNFLAATIHPWHQGFELTFLSLTELRDSDRSRSAVLPRQRLDEDHILPSPTALTKAI